MQRSPANTSVVRRVAALGCCSLVCGSAYAAGQQAVGQHGIEQHGQVLFAGQPMPGATVTATQGAKTVTTATDADGRYRFADLAEGTWTLTVAMRFFTRLEQQVTVAAGSPGIAWQMKMLPLAQVMGEARVVQPQVKAPVVETATAPVKPGTKPAETAAEMPKPAENSQAADGLLVNGSSNNAATSQFSLAQAFGNTRKGSKSLYTGGLALTLDNSAFDARPYSLTGLDTPKSNYNRLTATATFGGPLYVPHLLPRRRAPNFFLVYQWTRNSNADTQSGLVPTEAQRAQAAGASPLAQALLSFYPHANLAGNANYNYQVPILNHEHQDSLQLHLDKNIGPRDQVYGGYAFESARADTSNLFGFRDTTGTLGQDANAHYQHRLGHGLYGSVGYTFSRLRTLVSPYYQQNAVRFSAPAIAGRSARPEDVGPPTLIFSSGIAPLTDGIAAFNRNRTEALSLSVEYYRGRHNVTVGGDFRRQEFNSLSQANPRGTYNFTGAATGSDFGDFLAGMPDTSAIAFGNADKYLRQSVYDAYGNDDWRVRPDLTLNLGVRWEYGAPITEVKNRLVNLDVAPGFTQTAQVLASNPRGPLTGQVYPASLLRPDRLKIEPRVGVSWRPLAGSSVVVRAGYGVYADTSVYQATALQLAQQAPLSTSLALTNGAGCPLTLAAGFRTDCTTTTANTFAVDPNFRVGYAQTWQLAVQRDLPFALQMTATYLGIKGTRGVQEFLPQTYPLGGVDPCPACPSGYLYRTSNGNSRRHAGTLQLRRRLRSGFTATLTYTFSKSTDNDAVLGGQGPVAAGVSVTSSTPRESVAQNWLDLRAERSRSSFDQRHLFNASVQYTTGSGLGGGTLLGGWRGRVYKEWTVTGVLAAGSGLPETPLFYATVNGAGVTGTLRPDATGASVSAAPAGRFLNAAAYTAPQAGRFGNAGRYSIEGPGQLTFNSSLSRTFRLPHDLNLDARVDATNLLNHAVYTSYNTILNPSLVSPVFGLPVAANPMRSLQVTARMRF